MKKIKMRSAAPSVAEVFEDFLAACRAKGLADKTLQTYHYHFAAASKFLNTDVGIDQVTRRDIEQMTATMRGSLCATTISSYTRTLKSFFSWCRAEGLSTVEVNLYKAEETIQQTYSDAELKALLRKPKLSSCGFTEYRNWVIINLLLNCGCRAATVRNILVGDVNLTNGTITYRHTKNKSVQIVPLCSNMQRILKEYLRVYAADDGAYLFPNECGAQLTESGLRQGIARYNKSRGVAKTSIHLFRHSFAERYLLNGGNAFNLQRLLGHSTLDMTKHYCRIYDAELVKGYDRLSPLATLK